MQRLGAGLSLAVLATWACGGGGRAGEAADAGSMLPQAGAPAAGAPGTTAGGGQPAAGTTGALPAEPCAWTACGGDVVGRWRIATFCAGHSGSSLIEAECGIVRSTDTTAVGMEGTFTFAGDGTFTYEWTTTTEREVSTSLSCFEQQGYATCDDALDGFEDCAEAACTADRSTCRCTGTSCATATRGTIPWEQAGNANAIAFDCAAASDFAACRGRVDVCVVGDTMWLLWSPVTITALRE